MAKTNRTYEVHARPESDGWWTLEVPELSVPGPNGITALGGAPDVSSLDRSAKELVAVILDVPESDVSVNVVIDQS